MGKLIKKLFLLLSLVFLVSCASWNQKCDCSKEFRETKNSTSSTGVSGVSVVPPAPKMEEEKTVSGADIEVINKMIKAVDDYVFRQQKDEFTALCKDARFDCRVNEKRFPAGKSKVKRKISPFVSGSKTGLQDSVRITVRYSFYP